MKTIQLTGRLGKEFGNEYRMHVVSPAEAIRGLCLQINGFEDALKEGQYKVTRLYDNGQEIPCCDDGVQLSFGKATGYRIDPVVGGAKKNGIGKLVLGLVLVGAAFFTGGAAAGGLSALSETVAIGGVNLGISYGNIAFYGATMALQGAISLLAPTPKSPDKSESFTLNFSENVGQQGVAVPLVFGECFTGSVVISAGITAEEIENGDGDGGGGSGSGGPVGVIIGGGGTTDAPEQPADPIEPLDPDDPGNVGGIPVGV